MTKKKNKMLKATVASVLVTASLPASALAANSSFPDVDNNTHKEDINELVKSGILTGYPDGMFKPKKEITRGEAATILARALNLEVGNKSSVSFTDVAKDSYYYDAVAALVEAKIINGFSDNTFKPDDTLTREQMAKILGVAYNLSSDASSVFTDINKNSYAYAYINGLYEAAITLGVSNTAFNPTGHVTREQMASFVNRAMQHKQEHIISGEVKQASNDSVQIGNASYSLSNDLLTTISSTLLQSLENANVTIIVKNNQIINFKEIYLNEETKNFDGSGLTLDQLTFKEGVNTLQNVDAKKIEIATTQPSLKLTNIESEELKITKRKALAASLNVFAMETDFNVEFNEQNNITNVIIDADSLTYAASNKTSIEQLQLVNTKQVTLHSTVAKLQLNESTAISGTGQIKQLEILNKNAKIVLSNTITVGEYIFENKFYKFEQLEALGLSVQFTNAESTLPVDPDNNNSATTTPDQGSVEPTPSIPNESGSGGSTAPVNPNQGGSSNNGSTPSNPDQGTDNSAQTPSTPGEDTNNGSNTPLEGDTSTKVQDGEVALGTPASVVTTNGDQVSIKIKNTNVKVSDAALASLLRSEQLNNISSLDVIVENNAVVGVKALAFTATENTPTFNANNLQVGQLTISGANDVQNVTVTSNLTINTDGAVALTNVQLAPQATVNITGEVTAISGIESAQSLAVNTSAQTLAFNANESLAADVSIMAVNAHTIDHLNSTGVVTVTSGNNDLTLDIQASKLILEEPKIASYKFVKVAAFSMMPFATANQIETKITINNGSGDLIINRKQTLLDIQGNSYSTVEVSGTGNSLNGNIAHLATTAAVGYLTIFGNVNTMTIDGAETSLVITGGGIIGTLTVTNSKKQIIDISGVTVTTANDPDGSIISATVPNLPDLAVSFDKATKLGHYPLIANINGGEQLKFVQLKEGETIALDTLPSLNVETYDGTSAFIQYDTKNLAVFLVDGSNNLLKSTLIPAPTGNHSQITGFENKQVKFNSAFNKDTSLQSFAKYAYVFSGGKLTDSIPSLAGTAKYDAAVGYATWSLQTSLSTLKDVIIVVDNLTYTGSPTEATTVKALQTMAAEAVANDNPMMLYRPVTALLSYKEGIVIDQNLLEIYAERITANPASYNSVTALKSLVEEVADEIKYDQDVVPSLSTLLLEDDNVTFTSANNAIVTATATNGQILLMPGASNGITLLTAQDGAGNITKVAVQVDGGKIAQFVPQMFEQTDTISVVYGDVTKYRTKTDATGKKFIIPEADSTLIVRDSSGTGMDLQKLSFNTLGNPTDLTLAKTALTPASATLAALGLTAATAVENTNVGTIVEGTNVWFYPITTIETNLKLADGTNTTAVNAKPTPTTVDIEIAKTAPLNIANVLGLTNVEKVSNTANTTKIHGQATADEFTLFANDAATAAFTVEDGSGKKTLLNAQSLSTNGKITIDAPEIIVHNITESAAVYSYSENKVRIAGNKIYPTESGTAKVTLTDGTIYTIETSLLNNVYSSTVTKETAFKIDAAALGLADIVSATENIINGTATIANKQTVNNNELIFTMTDSGTAEVIVTATDGSKTLFYVTATKTNDTVSYSAAEIIKANVAKSALGFTGITGTVDSTKTYARTVHTNDDVTVYGYTAGKQAAEIYNGTEKALVNIVTTKDLTTNQLTVTPTVVEKTLLEAIHADATGGSIIRIAADGKLYAMNVGTTEIQVTSSNNDVKRYAQVTVSKDAVSGHYTIEEPTYVEKRVLSMDELGLTSIATATSNKSNIQTAVDGEEITITKTSNSADAARITVTGTNGETTYVHVTADFEVIVEKSNTIDLAIANLENITTTEWLNGTTVRAVTNNTSVTFYSLLTGNASFKATDSKGKAAIVNISDETTNGAKTKKAEIVQESLPTGETGSLIAGDALRVGDDGNTLFAQKAGTARILANGKVYEYTITEAASQYTISAPTIIADVLTIDLSTELGFTGPNSVKVENESVATAAISGDLLTIYKKSSGQTPITLTDATGKTLVFNLNTADATPANWLDVTAPIKLGTALTASPTLLHAIEDVGIIKVEANGGSYDVYAQKFGDVEVLYDGKVHRISVKNEQGIATVAIEEISSAIIKKAELGLANSLEIPSIYNQDDYFITKIGDDLVAYAKTPSSKQELTITDGTTNKTVVNLEANAAGYTTYSVAKEENVLTAPADYGLTDITSFIIKADKPYVRYSSNTLYALQQGETYATLSDDTSKALAAISVTRDATTNQLTANISPIKKSAVDLVAGATVIEAMPNNGTNTSIVDIRGDVLYATGLGTTFVRVDNYIVEVTVGMNPNTEKFEMTAIPMKSATVTSTQLGLNSITSYDLSANAAQVVQTVQNGNTLIFYGKAAGSAQVTVTQTDGVTTWNGLINVTVAGNGDITATPVKYNATITAPVENTPAVPMQNDDVRAIWNGTNVELYAVSEGKSSIVFDKGALNVEVKKDSTTGAYTFVGTPAFASTKIAATGLNVVSGSEFAHIEANATETTLVAKEAGKVVLLSANTIYEVTVSKDANGHVSISAPTALPFKSLDITGSYTIAGNAVSSMEANIDTDPENELIVYPTGTNGTSDIHFTSGTDQTTYQVTVNNNVFESASPKLAQVALNLDIANLTTASTKVRVDAVNNQLFLNTVGNAYLQGSNGFVNVVVTRDANGYFTATQAAVMDTLTEALEYSNATLTDYRLDGNNIYPLTALADEVLYTATKRVELATKVENDQIIFSKAEQDMEMIPYTDYNLVTPSIDANTFPTVAKAEVRADGKLIVYALNAGTTTITVNDGDNTLSIYATVDGNKNLTTTIAGQSAAINLADIGITGTVTLNAFEVDANGAVTLSPYTTTKVQPTITNGVIRFSAKETGKTSFAIAEGSTLKAFVNVEVYKDANDRLAARTTVVETNVDIATATKLTGPDLFRMYNGKHYATGVGTAVYKTAEGEATIVRIGEVQIDENTKTFSHSAAKRHLIELATAADYDLTAINSAIIADTAVSDGTVLNGKAYIYAKNNGVTDVLVADSANNKTIIQVTNTNGTLTSTIAKEALPTIIAAVNSSWTDANGLVQIRNGNIYALATGHTTIKDSNGVLANVTVQRDTTLPFKTEIELPKVQPVAGQNITVISGADAVHVAGDTLFAKAVGKAKIQVNGTIQEVEVKQLANGHYTIEAVPAKVQVHLNATELGLDTITGATLTSNIISTDIQDVDNAVAENELVLLAEQAGTAVLTVTGTVNGDTVQTKVQVTVKATNNVLSIDEPIIAATSNSTVALEKSNTYTNNSIVRAHGGELFALAAGETFVQDASGILYKVKAEQTDALRVAASELAYTFENATTITAISQDVTINGKKVSIKELDITADLDVDGVTYRLTVDANGQISVQSLAQNTVDLSEVFDGTATISADATAINGFLKVTQVPNTATLTLEPLQTAEAEKVILVTSNGQTVQLLVKVAAEGNGYKATAELISKQFAAADIGFHMDDEAFTISNGIAKVVGGVLKVYPGAVGKQDFIVQHTVNSNALRKTIMRLDVTGLNQFTVGKLTHTVTDATFTDTTKVIAQQGTALAIGGTDMTITNFDGSSTLFIVNGSDGYRQFKVSTTLNTLTNTYDIVQTAVQRPYEVVGDVTNVNGTFYTVKDSNNTIIFSTTNGTGSAIVNGVIHNLVADNTENNLVTASPVVATLTGDYTFVAGTDNITKQADGSWVAKAQGTAYYKNAAGYKKVTVALNTDNQYEVSIIDVAHQTLDAAYSNITLLKHPAEVFVDGHTIYGEVDTSNIVVSAFDGESRVVLTGTTLSNNAATTDLSPLKLNVLTELGWTNVDSWVMNSGNNVGRIEKNDASTELYVQNFGNFKATFKAASGVTKTLEFDVDANYNISPVTVGNNTISYELTLDNNGTTGNDAASAFNITFDLTFTEVSSPLKADPSNPTFDMFAYQNVAVVTPMNGSNYNGQLIITTTETPNLKAVINATTANNTWNVTVTDSNTDPTTKVEFIEK